MNSNVMWEVVCLIRGYQKESAPALFRNRDMPASSSGASFSARLRRATGDEPQGTLGRVQTAGETRCLLPAFRCAHIFIERETSGYEAGDMPCWCGQEILLKVRFCFVLF